MVRSWSLKQQHFFSYPAIHDVLVSHNPAARALLLMASRAHYRSSNHQTKNSSLIVDLHGGIYQPLDRPSRMANIVDPARQVWRVLYVMVALSASW